MTSKLEWSIAYGLATFVTAWLVMVIIVVEGAR